MSIFRGRKVLVDLIRKTVKRDISSTLKGELMEGLVAAENRLHDLREMCKRFNFERDELREKNHLLKVSLEEVESKVNLQVTRKVFSTMLYCLERPLKNLDYQIESLGIEILNPGNGDTFDPTVHEPVNESGSTKIVRTLRKGYLYRGACLRPALVELETERP